MNPILFVAALGLVSDVPHPAEAVVQLDRTTVVHLALAHSPKVQTARAQVASVALLRPLVAASPHPVDVDGEAGPRIGLDGDVGLEAAVSVSRRLELGGKAARRIDVADASAEAAQSALRAVQIAVEVEALVLWSRWLGSLDRAHALASTAGLSRRVVGLLKKKAELGAATRLEVNATRLALAQVEADLAGELMASEALEAELRLLLGVSAPVMASSDRQSPPVPSLDAVISSASQAAPEVAVAQAAAEKARARARLGRAEGTTDVRLGGALGVEGREVFALLTVGIELPAPGRAEHAEAMALAESRAASVGADAAGMDRALVAARAWRRYQVFTARAAATEGPQRALIEESRRLLETALDAGQGTATALLLLSQEAARAELSAIAARTSAREEALVIDVFTRSRPE